MAESPLFYTSHPMATNNAIASLSQEMATNASSMRKFFQDFLDKRRDLDAECGWPSAGTDDSNNYRELFDRMPVARRVVELMPKECWQVQPKVYESEDSEDATPFEQAWDNLGKNLRGETSWYQDEEGSPVWEYLKRADIMSGIGRFGVLLLGIDDGLRLDEPVEGVVSVLPVKNSEGVEVKVAAPSTPTVNKAAFHAGRPATDHKKDPEGYQAPLYNPCFAGNEDSAKEALAAEEASVSNFVVNETKKYTRPPTENYSQGPQYDNGVYGLSGARMGTDAQYVGVQLSPPEYPAAKPSGKKRNLLFLRVFDESLVQIVQYESDLRNPRFGKPVMYRITLNDPRDQGSGIGLPIATMRVHWSRVIHIADGLQSSEVFGAPRMRPVLNDLLDLKKIYGASAEGYWKAAFSILQFSTHPQMGGDVAVDMDRMRETYENVQNSLQRGVIGVGGAWSTIAPTVTDPTPHINVRMNVIALYLGCPMRVFLGSEQGVLAADQDSVSWYLRRVPERQQNYCTPRIIIPFTDRLIQMNVLPEPTQGNDDEDEETDTAAASKGLGEGVDNATSARKESYIFSGEDCPKCGASMEGDSYSGKCNSCGHKWGKLTHTSNEHLPPGIYRRTRIRYEEVYNADTSMIEKKPVESQSTVIVTSGGYSIEWPDLDAITAKDKAAILAQRTTAYGTYISMGVENMISPKDYMTKFDDMDEEEAEAILQATQDAHAADDTMTTPPMDGGQPQAPEEGDAEFEPPLEPDPAVPIKVKPGEKLVHPDSVKPPTGNAEVDESDWDELEEFITNAFSPQARMAAIEARKLKSHHLAFAAVHHETAAYHAGEAKKASEDGDHEAAGIHREAQTATTALAHKHEEIHHENEGHQAKLEELTKDHEKRQAAADKKVSSAEGRVGKARQKEHAATKKVEYLKAVGDPKAHMAELKKQIAESKQRQKDAKG